MYRRLRGRFWAELMLSATTALLLLLTVLWQDWIEHAFGIDPDQHSGELEWALVAALAISTLVSTALAGGEWRRARPAPQIEHS